MMAMPPWTTLVWAALLGLAVAQDDSSPLCYFPDKSLDTASVPCNAKARQEGGHTSCCLPNDLCFESGACYQDWTGIMYRHSCTDPTFRDPACPQICLEDGFLEGGAYFQTCDMLNKKACCLTTRESCCNDESGLFDFVPGETVAVLDTDGKNRLDTDASVVTVWSSSIPTPSGLPPPSSSLSDPDPEATAPPADGSTQGPDEINEGESSLPSAAVGINETGAIAGLAVLGFLLATSMAVCGFLWSKYDGERKKNAVLQRDRSIAAAAVAVPVNFDNKDGHEVHSGGSSPGWQSPPPEQQKLAAFMPGYYHPNRQNQDASPLSYEPQQQQQQPQPQPPPAVQSELEGHGSVYELAGPNYPGK